MITKKKLIGIVKGIQVIEVACGVGTILANKGAVCIILRIKGKTIAFVNAHLAAHQTHVRHMYINANTS